MPAMAWQGNVVGRLKKAWRYRLALHHRQRMAQVIHVGITGTSGKTTTVALAAAILREAGPCEQTRGFNALHDVIRTIRRTGRGHRYCVTELAAARPGTLDPHLRLVRPDIAVLTMIGNEHYTAFRGVGAIAAEKAKVVLAPPADGIAVLNIDDPLVRDIGGQTSRRVIWFGSDPAATLRLVAARSNWPEPLTLVIDHGGERHEIRTALHGQHLAVPVLAALGIAVAAGLPLAAAIPVIGRFEPAEGRMQPVTMPDGITWIRDDRKAPAWSFRMPFEFLRDASASRKVAIVGTVSDTHGDSGRNYRNFGRIARGAADLAVFVGPNAHRALRARTSTDDDSIQTFPTAAAAAIWLRTALRAGDLVLLKASHNADHLMRLLLDREAPITCWRERCDKASSCAGCPELRRQ